MADKTYVSRYDGTMVKVGNRYQTVNKGAAVPDGADADHVAVLAERGMVAEGEPAAGFILDDDAQPPFDPAGVHSDAESKSGRSRSAAAKES